MYNSSINVIILLPYIRKKLGFPTKKTTNVQTDCNIENYTLS